MLSGQLKSAEAVVLHTADPKNTGHTGLGSQLC